jgi:hypothetical protein
MRRQPDNRVHPENLGMMILNGKRFVVNLRPGVPFNACIEEYDGFLRCWASQNPLDQRAAIIMEGYATKTDGGAFVWNDGVKRGPVACVKGDRPLYRVVFP